MKKCFWLFFQFEWAEGHFVTDVEEEGQPGTFSGEGTFQVIDQVLANYVHEPCLLG